MLVIVAAQFITLSSLLSCMFGNFILMHFKSKKVNLVIFIDATFIESIFSSPLINYYIHNLLQSYLEK